MLYKFTTIFCLLIAAVSPLFAAVNYDLLDNFDRGNGGVAARHQAWCTPADQGSQWLAWFDLVSDDLQARAKPTLYSRSLVSIAGISFAIDSWPLARGAEGIGSLLKLYKDIPPETAVPNPCSGPLLAVCASLWNDGLQGYFSLNGLPPMVGGKGLAGMDRNSGGWLRDSGDAISRWWQTGGTDFCASTSGQADKNNGITIGRTLAQINATWLQIRSLARTDQSLMAFSDAHQSAMASSGLPESLIEHPDSEGEWVTPIWADSGPYTGYTVNDDGIMLHVGRKIAPCCASLPRIRYRRGHQIIEGAALPMAFRRFSRRLVLHGLVTKKDTDPDRTFAVDTSGIPSLLQKLLPVAGGGRPPLRRFRMSALHWWQLRKYLKYFDRAYRESSAAPAMEGPVPATMLWPGGPKSPLLIASRKVLFTPRVGAALVHQQAASFYARDPGSLSPLLMPFRSLLDNAVLLCQSTALLRHGVLAYEELGSTPSVLQRMLGPFDRLCGLLPNYGTGSAEEAARTTSRLLADSSLYWDGFIALARERGISRVGVCPINGAAIGALARSLAGDMPTPGYTTGCPAPPPESMDESGFSHAQKLLSGQLSEETLELGNGKRRRISQRLLGWWIGVCSDGSRCPPESFRQPGNPHNLLQDLTQPLAALPTTSVLNGKFSASEWTRALDSSNRALFSDEQRLRLITREKLSNGAARIVVFEFSRNSDSDE